MTKFTSQQIRRVVLEQAYRARVGHIGSALSIIDILAAIFSNLKSETPDSPDRDRFVLSNGHAALALYSLLYVIGILSKEKLDTYCASNSYLGVHPEHVVPGIDFSTGSLGQGLSFGAGCALAARLQGSKRKVFVLLSDAECNEGSVWETVIFAAHHQLSNLIVTIDLNGQQALGYTSEVLDLNPMSEKWKAFQWDVHDVDGNDVDAMTRLIQSLDTTSGPPHVLVAHTIFGHGVSFMEKQIKWHYMPFTDEQFRLAMQENGTES